MLCELFCQARATGDGSITNHRLWSFRLRLASMEGDSRFERNTQSSSNAVVHDNMLDSTGTSPPSVGVAGTPRVQHPVERPPDHAQHAEGDRKQEQQGDQEEQGCKDVHGVTRQCLGGIRR